MSGAAVQQVFRTGAAFRQADGQQKVDRPDGAAAVFQGFVARESDDFRRGSGGVDRLRLSEIERLRPEEVLVKTPFQVAGVYARFRQRPAGVVVPVAQQAQHQMVDTGRSPAGAQGLFGSEAEDIVHLVREP